LGWHNTVKAILSKDLKQYYTQAPVIGWGLLFPLTLAVLLGFYGSGMGAWRTVPGIISVSILFGASTMGQVVVSFDSLSGGFELYIHAPVKPGHVVVGKMLGGFVLGLAGSLLAALVLYVIVGALPVVHLFFLVAGLILGSLIFSLIGVAVSLAFEPLRAVTVLNALRFGMIFLGGLLPATVLPSVVYPLVWTLPMCYVSDLIRYGTFNLVEYTTPLTSLAALIIYSVMLYWTAVRLADKLFYP
jgi:ABC-2 type transport system permease protein